MCHPALEILTLFQTKNVIFQNSFQTKPLKYISDFCLHRQKLRYHVLSLQLRQQKRFPKIHFEFSYCSFFLIHLELKRQIRLYTPVVPSKAIPISRPQWTKSTPVFRPKRRKRHTQWGGTYLYGLYKVVLPQVSWYFRRYSVTHGSRDGFLPHLLVRPKTTPSEP